MCLSRLRFEVRELLGMHEDAKDARAQSGTLATPAPLVDVTIPVRSQTTLTKYIFMMTSYDGTESQRLCSPRTPDRMEQTSRNVSRHIHPHQVSYQFGMVPFSPCEKAHPRLYKQKALVCVGLGEAEMEGEGHAAAGAVRRSLRGASEGAGVR